MSPFAICVCNQVKVLEPSLDGTLEPMEAAFFSITYWD